MRCGSCRAATSRAADRVRDLRELELPSPCGRSRLIALHELHVLSPSNMRASCASESTETPTWRRAAGPPGSTTSPGREARTSLAPPPSTARLHTLARLLLYSPLLRLPHLRLASPAAAAAAQLALRRPHRTQSFDPRPLIPRRTYTVHATTMPSNDVASQKWKIALVGASPPLLPRFTRMMPAFSSAGPRRAHIRSCALACRERQLGLGHRAPRRQEHQGALRPVRPRGQDVVLRGGRASSFLCLPRLEHTH